MILKDIDEGKAFDWGKTSQDYAKYRDIYPQEFYDTILNLGLCKNGQDVLDIGTGTGVLPRNLYKYGAKWTGTDIAENQIEMAKTLAKEKNMDINFFTCPAEKISLPENSFDVITACQCIWYPDAKITAPLFSKLLRNEGKFLILYLGWQPYEDEIIRMSEDLVLKYNPSWTGAYERKKEQWVPEPYLEYFDVASKGLYDIKIDFTRESWHGRIRACRGVGASLSTEQISLWDKEHWEMLKKNTPEKFKLLHYVSYAELTKK